MSAVRPPVLAPMNVADILDAAVRLYRRNFGPFLSIIAIVYVPMALIQTIVMFTMMRGMQGLTENAGEMPDTGTLVSFGVGYMILIGVYVLAMPIAQGALAVAVSRRYLGYPVTVADAYGSIGSRWGSLILVDIVVGLAVMVGMLFCFVPGIYLGVMWLFVTPIIAIEGLGLSPSLNRSWQLVSGEWWRCFVTYFLLSLLVSIVTAAIAYPVAGVAILLLGEKQMAVAQAIQTGVSTGMSCLVQPLLIIGLVLQYYDLRIRKEGFDLYVLAEAMKLPPTEQMAYEATIKAATPVGQPYLSMAAVSPGLADYVRQAKSVNMPYDQARRELVAGGWPADLVDRELPLAWADPAVAPPPVAPPPVGVPPTAVPTGGLEPPLEPPAAAEPPPPVDPFSPEAPPPQPPPESP